MRQSLALLAAVTAPLARYFESRETKSRRFVDSFVEPDMLANGFGFGRRAVSNALVRLRITSFDQLFSLTAEQLETIRTARGVGPKVVSGFEKYLAKRGVLPASETQEPVAVVTEDNTSTRIDVV